MSMKIIELLQTLAHERSDAVPYFTAHTLPASGDPTDPNDGAATAGNGLAIPVPSWAINAMVFVGYAIGAGGTSGVGDVAVDAFVGPAAGSPLVLMSPNLGPVGVNGAALPILGIAGAATIGFRFAENNDPSHPGIVTVSIVFSR